MLLAIFRTTRSLSRSLVDNKTGDRSAAKQSIVSQLTIVSDSFEAADTSQPNCFAENSQPLSPLIELSELPVKSTNDSDEWKNITRNYTLLWDWNITLVLQQQENVVLSKCNYSTNRCDLWTELTIREDINRKKTFSFGHCPNHLNPPPHDPNSGNLVLFFRTSKTTF